MIGGQVEPTQIDVTNRYPDGSILFGVVTLRTPATKAAADTPVMLRRVALSAGPAVAILPALQKHDVAVILVDRVAIGDAGERFGEIGLRVEAVQFGSRQDGYDRRGAVAALVAACEQSVAATESNSPHGIFGNIIVGFEHYSCNF